MATAQPTCSKCGSTTLRHARSRNTGHRWLRDYTEWDRYACGSCGHRGWTYGKLRNSPTLPNPTKPAQGRPSERRDHRSMRRQQLRILLTVAAGLLLGVMAAWFVMRMAGG